MRKVYHMLVGSTLVAAAVFGSAVQAQSFMQAPPTTTEPLFLMASTADTRVGASSGSFVRLKHKQSISTLLDNALPIISKEAPVNQATPPNTVPIARCKNLKMELMEGCSLMVDAAAFDNGSFDADNDNLAFSVSPEGPYPVGTTTVTFRVDDGKMSNQCTAQITVQDKLPPVVVANPITLSLTAQGTVTITANQIDAGSTDNCAINTKTLSKTQFTCADLGENLVNLIVTDTQGNQATAETTITIVDLEAPVVAASYDFVIDENLEQGSQVGQLLADDNCGEIGYFIKSGNVNNAFGIDYAGRLKVKNAASLDYETTREFTLLVEVADNSDNVALSQVLVRLNNLNDHIPQVAMPIAAQETLEDAVYTLTIPATTFTDADVDDRLTITAHELPDWLQFNSTTLQLQGTPLNNHVGTVSIKIRATDKAEQYAEHTISLRVVNTNDIPQVGEVLAQQEILEDAAYTFTIPTAAFTDIDAGDVLNYTTGKLPAWLQFDNQTATFTGVPLNEDVGQHEITLRATDAGGLIAEQRFILNVLNTNDAPNAISLSNDQMEENASRGSFIGELSSKDADAGDTHVYSLVAGAGDSDNASFTLEGSRLLTAHKLNFEEKEIYTLRVSSQDKAGATLEEVFTIKLSDVEDSRAFLPTMFTPNGDGSNDRFILRAYAIGQLNFRIYNKQGRIVYQTNTVSEATELGWDGSTKGIPQPEGPYVWQLDGRYKDGSPLTIDGKTLGNLILIR